MIWLSIIGIGEDGLAGLVPEARAALDSAATIVGGARHLAMLGPTTRPTLTWERPLGATIAKITALRGTPVAVLASGDPMWFGIGATLARHVPIGEMRIFPQVGAFSLAAARLGWSIADIACVSLHGRGIEHLALHLAPGTRVLALSQDGETPAAVGAFLTAQGYGDSKMTVLAHLGGAETITRGRAGDRRDRAPDLNVIALELVAGPDAAVLPLTGLPDDAFTHDGQLTKQEIRSASVAALVPARGHLLWDVGAGCGSIAIEWMRAGGRAIAIERDAVRVRLIRNNAASLGVPKIEIVHGAAPAALAGLESPDAVFIGGGLSDDVIAPCWAALKPGGRMVANAVTIEGEAALIAARARRGGGLTRISVSRAEPVGDFLGWRPLMPVTQWRARKP